MKREGHIYLLVGLVVTALVFFQYNPFRSSPEKIVSEVKQVSDFSKLLLDVNCNIFFVKDINAIEIGDLLKKAGSSEILNDRMKIIVNNNNKVIIGINTTNQKV